MEVKRAAITWISAVIYLKRITSGINCAVSRSKSHILISNPTHHRDTKTPYVWLDTVAFLVEVRVDPLGLKWKWSATDKYRHSLKIIWIILNYNCTVLYRNSVCFTNFLKMYSFHREKKRGNYNEYQVLKAILISDMNETPSRIKKACKDDNKCNKSVI